MTNQIKHKVFVSYHHDLDQGYRDKFEKLFAHKIFVSKSVQIGEIDENLPTDTIRQKIREKYLCDSTVTVVLVGKCTWQRKHVDWEISSSIRDTVHNSRSGLLGIMLPSHPNYYDKDSYSKGIIPPRLHDNIDCGYARLYGWIDDADRMYRYIELAFNARESTKPNNAYPSFSKNRTGESWDC